MKKNQINRGVTFYFIAALLFCNFLTVSSNEFENELLWSFETIKKKRWDVSKGHKISVSADHYKHGAKSLVWNWQAEGAITLNHNIGFEPFNPEGEDKSIPSFAIWIYNETPLNDDLKQIGRAHV